MIGTQPNKASGTPAGRVAAHTDTATLAGQARAASSSTTASDRRDVAAYGAQLITKTSTNTCAVLTTATPAGRNKKASAFTSTPRGGRRIQLTETSWLPPPHGSIWLHLGR